MVSMSNLKIVKFIAKVNNSKVKFFLSKIATSIENEPSNALSKNDVCEKAF
jgi:hypothetical protein